MANTRSAIKRVRQNARRVAINGPRRTAAKSYVGKALRVAGGGQDGDPAVALAEAMSALDRAAKTGAIHPNAAARRKSRLARKVTAALGGVPVEAGGRVRATGKAAAAKAARARVAASKARQEAGPKTAAGKARVALAKTTAGTKAAAGGTTAKAASTATRSSTRTTARGAAAKSTSSKATGSKATASKTKPKREA